MPSGALPAMASVRSVWRIQQVRVLCLFLDTDSHARLLLNITKQPEGGDLCGFSVAVAVPAAEIWWLFPRGKAQVRPADGGHFQLCSGNT